MRPADTSPDVWKVFIDLQRKLTPFQKLEMVFGLSDSLWSLSRASVRQRFPDADDREVFLRTAARRLDRDTMLKVFHFDERER